MKKICNGPGASEGRRKFPGLLLLLSFFFFCFLRSVLEVSAAGENPGKEKQTERASFIKKEVLKYITPEMASVKRDLFRPAAVTAARREIGAVRPVEPVAEVTGVSSVLDSLNLSCPGLVQSGNKRLALIIVDGQTITLAEGEELLPGIKLVSISADEVIFRDDRGNQRKVRVRER
ncbi:MAG: hypothetical protein WBI18_09850 [Candidatus Saccharicenans sp.]